MGDSFVDVTYRGLEVGRRLRIRDFTGDVAYVEVPTPMPVGSPLDLATDEGVTIAAVVARVHEQVGGSDRPPGMNVRATLDGAARAWWDAQVGAPTPVPVPAPVPMPAPVLAGSGAASSAGIPLPISPEVTEPSGAESGPILVPPLERARTASGGNGEIVDDNKRTQTMSTTDIEAVVAAGPPSERSGPIATGEDSADIDLDSTGDEDISGETPTNGNGNGSASAKKRKRRRRKSK
jgi:hypothetical protein